MGRASRPPYTDEEKRNALILFMSCGKFREVSRRTGIHTATLCTWAKRPWWNEWREAIIAERQKDPICLDLNNRLNNVIGRLVARLEAPGIIENLKDREVAFAVRELMKAKLYDRPDEKKDIEELAEAVSLPQLDKIVAELLHEIREDRRFGESGRDLDELPSVQALLREIEAEDAELGGQAQD